MRYEDIPIVHHDNIWAVKFGEHYLEIGNTPQFLLSHTKTYTKIHNNFEYCMFAQMPVQLQHYVKKRPVDFWWDQCRLKHDKPIVFIKYHNGGEYYWIYVQDLIELQWPGIDANITTLRSNTTYKLTNYKRVSMYAWSEIPASYRKGVLLSNKIFKMYDPSYNQKKKKEKKHMKKKETIIHAESGWDAVWCKIDNIDENHLTSPNWTHTTCIPCLEAGIISGHFSAKDRYNELKELDEYLEKAKPKQKKEEDKVEYIHYNEYPDEHDPWCGKNGECDIDIEYVTCKACLFEIKESFANDSEEWQVANDRMNELGYNKPNSKEKGEKPMKKDVKDTAMTVAGKNKGAATMAAQIEVGKIANSKITKLLAAKAPLMTRGYIKQYPQVVGLLAANVISMGVEQYAPQNKKAAIVADCMMNAAWLELTSALNIEDKLDELLKMIPTDLLEKLHDDDEDGE